MNKIQSKIKKEKLDILQKLKKSENKENTEKMKKYIDFLLNKYVYVFWMYNHVV